ncbi:MAG: hypothetical protein AAF206_29385 [Bacteroidota bacterium]
MHIRFSRPCLLLMYLATFCHHSLIAQKDVEIRGQVVEHNSTFRTGEVKTISMVNVSARSFSTTSDALGNFTLLVSGDMNQKFISVSARKKGMEVVNQRELANVDLSRSQPLRIVMADPTQLAQAQLAFYQIAEEAIYQSRDRKIALLEKQSVEKEQMIEELKRSSFIQIENLADVKRALDQQLEKELEAAKLYTSKLSRVDLTFANEQYRKAYRAFKNGNLDTVSELLSVKNLSKSLQTIDKEKSEIKKLVDESAQLEKLIVDRETKLKLTEKNLLESSLLAANTAMIQGKKQLAAKHYQTIVRIDSTNPDTWKNSSYY